MISKNNLRSFAAQFSRLVKDESGGEVVESVLVVALIAIICIAAMKGVSVLLGQRWNDVLDML